MMACIADTGCVELKGETARGLLGASLQVQGMLKQLVTENKVTDPVILRVLTILCHCASQEVHEAFPHLF